MKILAFLTDHPSSSPSSGIELPHAPPLISPARGPPQRDFLLDQSPDFDPIQAEPVPRFVFDQSLSHIWASPTSEPRPRLQPHLLRA